MHSSGPTTTSHDRCTGNPFWDTVSLKLLEVHGVAIPIVLGFAMKSWLALLVGAVLIAQWQAIAETVESDPVSFDQKRLEDARQYYDEGLMSHDEGKLDDALPFYRAAVRLYPESVEYLLRLGNTEFQLGFLEQANRRFKRVLTLDPKSTSAKYFIKMIDSKLRKQSNMACITGECADGSEDTAAVRTTQALQELPMNVLERDSDGQAFLFPSFAEQSRRPFIIRGALQHVACNLGVFDPSSLNETYSSHLVDFYPQNMLSKPTKVYTVPLSKALDYLAYPEGAYFSVDTSEPGTYIQWNMNETTWDSLLDSAGLLNALPAVLTHSMDSLLEPLVGTASSAAVAADGSSEDINGANKQARAAPKHSAKDAARVKHAFGHKTHWYMLLIGEKGSAMFGHYDTLAVGSWQAQVAGSKHWTLCAPDPNHEGKSNDCYEATLQTGDLIYYPPYYWHETMNLETPTVSLSGTVVVDSPLSMSDASTEGNVEHTTYRDELVAMLKAECRNNKKGFSFDLMFCDIMIDSQKV